MFVGIGLQGPAAQVAKLLQHLGHDFRGEIIREAEHVDMLMVLLKANLCKGGLQEVCRACDTARTSGLICLVLQLRDKHPFQQGGLFEQVDLVCGSAIGFQHIQDITDAFG